MGGDIRTGVVFWACEEWQVTKRVFTGWFGNGFMTPDVLGEFLILLVLSLCPMAGCDVTLPVPAAALRNVASIPRPSFTPFYPLLLNRDIMSTPHPNHHASVLYGSHEVSNFHKHFSVPLCPSD